MFDSWTEFYFMQFDGVIVKISAIFHFLLGAIERTKNVLDDKLCQFE